MDKIQIASRSGIFGSTTRRKIVNKQLWKYYRRIGVVLVLLLYIFFFINNQSLVLKVTTEKMIRAIATPSSYNYNKTLWMYWNKGYQDLASKTDKKYQADSNCVEAWKTMNPTWDIRFLNETDAMSIAPGFASIIRSRRTGRRKKELKAVMLSDLLRLELLSRYGGVYTDTSICPFRPLDVFLPKLYGWKGFFIPPLGGGDFAGSIRDIKKLHEKHGRCDTHPPDNMADTSRSVDTFFLAASKPNMPVFTEWYNAFQKRVEKMATECIETQICKREEYERLGKKCSPCSYPYFYVHCTFTQLRIASPEIEEIFPSIHNDPQPWSNENYDGICYGGADLSKYNDTKYPMKRCYWVKKQIGGLADYVMSDSYMEYAYNHRG